MTNFAILMGNFLIFVIFVSTYVSLMIQCIAFVKSKTIDLTKKDIKIISNCAHIFWSSIICTCDVCLRLLTSRPTCDVAKKPGKKSNA